MPRKLHLEIALGGNYQKEGKDAKQSSMQVPFFLCKKISLYLSHFKGNTDGTDRELKDSREETGISQDSCGMSGRANDDTLVAPGSSTENIGETDLLLKDTENAREKKTQANNSMHADKSGHLHALKHEINPEIRSHETATAHCTSFMHQGSDSLVPGKQGGSYYGLEGPEPSNKQGAQTSHLSLSTGPNKLLNTEGTVSIGSRISNLPSRGSQGASLIHQEFPAERVGTLANQSDIFKGNDFPAKPLKPELPVSIIKEENAQTMGKESGMVDNMVYSSKNPDMFYSNVPPSERSSADSDLPISINVADISPSGLQKHDSKQSYNPDGFKMMTINNSLGHGNTGTLLEKSVDSANGNNLETDDTPGPPKYTTSEKWIMDQQKRKLAEDQKWAVKQRKAEERITASFNKLKVCF